MIRFILVLCIANVAFALKFMTINLHRLDDLGRDNQTLQAADLIVRLNPDIIAVQKTGAWYQYNPFKNLLNELGDGWSGIESCYSLTGILTRHEIIGLYDHVSRGFNARIRLNETSLEVSVWSMLLSHVDPGPHAAKFHGKEGLERILIGEKMRPNNLGRINNMVELLKHREFVQQIKNSDNVPVFVAGEFFTPSHRDWTEETKDIHYGLVVEWPVTKLIENAAGMTDSFREVHPDPSAYPGYTLEVKNGDAIEYKERDDFIFHRGPFHAISSETFEREGNAIGYPYNPRRARFFALLSEFELMSHNHEHDKPSFFINPEYTNGTFVMTGKCEAKLL